VPKSHVYRVVRSGEVRVNSGRIKPDYRLKSGDRVRIPPIRIAEKPAVAKPVEFPVVFEGPCDPRGSTSPRAWRCTAAAA